MHELGIMTSVMEAVEECAIQAGATSVLKVTLRVGEMTEAIEDALQFAFEVLKEGTIANDAELEVIMVPPKSVCLECGAEYTHSRFTLLCPECNSPATQLIEGKELEIASLEVNIPDEEEGKDQDACPSGHSDGELGEEPDKELA